MGETGTIDMISIIQGDARHLPLTNDSVHLVITSPPYDVGISYSQHDDNMGKEEHLSMLNKVWDECYRVLVPGGRLCVNVVFGAGRNPYYPLASHVMCQLEVTYLLMGTIVWHKNTKGFLTSWGSWRKPNLPCFRDVCEAIIVARKPGKFQVPKFDTPGGYSPYLDKDTFLELTRDLWVVPPTTPGKSKHPAAFPVAIPARLIKLFAYPGALVLDPFAGSGSTGQAAKDLGANAVLVDIDPSYCDLMRSKLVNQTNLFKEIA
jgi:modification methylase